MNDSLATYYEKRLRREIEEVEQRIRQLTEEKYALQRQLQKALREAIGLSDVNRKNSISRIMIEKKVLEALSTSKKPLETSALYRIARVVSFELKENTFRNHMFRMKNKGLVEPAGRNGIWRIPAPRAAEG